ncbi:MAG TPA: glycerate kinase [Flexivirga sp.]|uniref:glycerate kinase n=1 Tax=Flexivirga sp. TaxID=1962927 RepID=UPI002B5CCB88|nr:glycerate kinase [Flexivirga sp.]HWC23561.1 glycerate kinase [Flexivirga sp.]
MHVLICGDHWEELSAVDITAAIAQGWSARQPHTEVTALPFSSGGRGFVDALSHALDADPQTPQTDWSLWQHGVAYLDGAALTRDGDSAPLGSALANAVTDGARRIVVGVGESGGVDGGAGLLRALGGSDDLAVAVPRANEILRTVQVVAAYREDMALVGLKGASASAVETLGWTRQEAQDNERRIGEFADQVRRLLPTRKDLLTGKVHRLDSDAGSGAGGGVGFALAALGARLVPGADVFAEAVGLQRHIANADLVVVATEVLDWRNLDDDTVATTVRAAAADATPAIVLAEHVDLGRRETMSLGASAAYSLVDPHAMRRRVDPDKRAALAALARRLAGTWSAS